MSQKPSSCFVEQAQAAGCAREAFGPKCSGTRQKQFVSREGRHTTLRSSPSSCPQARDSSDDTLGIRKGLSQPANGKFGDGVLLEPALSSAGLCSRALP